MSRGIKIVSTQKHIGVFSWLNERTYVRCSIGMSCFTCDFYYEHITLVVLVARIQFISSHSNDSVYAVNWRMLLQ